jgi:alkanesulfonate monooxygenase SsuD/methylene tetrahydromethanopterin reductase-like flavin-dependent oxidoreductase (luciferase family)
MEFGLFTLMDFHAELQTESQYYQDTIDLIVGAEANGYSSAWVGEEHFYSFGVCPSPQVLLSALAQRTDTMRLGTSISLLPFEHPIRKAEDFAMLDILAGGRLDYGVGRGAIQRHFEGFAVDPAESKPRYEESLAIIKKAWTERPFSYDGKFWKVSDVTVSPRPVQRPHPPIYRGTVSVESYQTAGEMGDNAFVTAWLVAPHAEMRTRLDRFRAISANNNSTPREAAVFFMFCDPDQRAAIREAREVTGAYARFISGHAKGRALVGADRGTAPGPNSSLFSQRDFILSIEDHVEERAIVGTPRACIRRLEEIDEELGLDQVLVYFHAGAWDITKARRNLELFGKEVIPHFAGGN